MVMEQAEDRLWQGGQRGVLVVRPSDRVPDLIGGLCYPTEPAYTTISVNYSSLSLTAPKLYSPGHAGPELPEGADVHFQASGRGASPAPLTYSLRPRGRPPCRSTRQLNCVVGNCMQPRGPATPRLHALRGHVEQRADAEHEDTGQPAEGEVADYDILRVGPGAPLWHKRERARRNGRGGEGQRQPGRGCARALVCRLPDGFPGPRSSPQAR